MQVTRARTAPAALVLAALASILTACSVPPDPDPESEPAEDTPPDGGTPRLDNLDNRSPRPRETIDVREPVDVQVALGFTPAGEVALFDAQTGTLLSQAAGAGLGGEADVACDRWHSRAILFEGDPEGQWGEISSLPIEAAPRTALGARKHEVWVDGVARVAPSPFGALVFEDGGYGPRWKLLAADGDPTASVFAPRPASIDIVGAGDFRVRALTYGVDGDALDQRSALVLPTGIQAPSVTSLPAIPTSDPPSVRRAVSDIGAHLVSTSSGDVVIATLLGASWTAPAPLGVGPGVRRIEHVAALPGDAALAVLTSPTPDLDIPAKDLIVARLLATGEVECAATLDLPGEPAEAALFFSRALIASPGRVLAATSSGVFAVSIGASCPIELTVDSAFDGDALRGPLDTCSLP